MPTRHHYPPGCGTRENASPYRTLQDRARIILAHKGSTGTSRMSHLTHTKTCPLRLEMLPTELLSIRQLRRMTSTPALTTLTTQSKRRMNSTSTLHQDTSNASVYKPHIFPYRLYSNRCQPLPTLRSRPSWAFLAALFLRLRPTMRNRNHSYFSQQSFMLLDVSKHPNRPR